MDERFIAPLSNDIRQLWSEAEVIAGDWNGESSRYTSGGEVYNEDDASLYREIADTAKALALLLDEVTTS